MSTIWKIVGAVLWLICWGFFISIGFWLGHKMCAGLDNKIGRYVADLDGRRAADKVAAEMEEEHHF